MHQIAADSKEVEAVLGLIQRAFASMDGRIFPPSSMHRLTVHDVSQQARDGEVWAIGEPVVACVFMMPRVDSLYIGKLAVDGAARGRGHARALVKQAEARARALGLERLELMTRVELRENHRVFKKLGFEKTGESAHEGFEQATSFTFAKWL
jgi:ribosomal protein S18 acetylase RimI-like enzyme